MKKWIIRMWRKIANNGVQDRTVNDDHLPVNKPPTEVDSDDYKVWIPFAENVRSALGLKMRSRGEFRSGYPEGIVVHWTSGWHLPRGKHINPYPIRNTKLGLSKLARKYAIRAIKGGIESGYNFLTMDVLGVIYQSSPLTKWGYHAGKSSWPGLGKSVSNRVVGIELLNPSTASKKSGRFLTWFKYELPEELVRQTDRGNFYHYSIEQEESLFRLCVWLYENSPIIGGCKVFNISNIVGHDEVSPGRKNDPGHALSMSMAQFRNRVRKAVM